MFRVFAAVAALASAVALASCATSSPLAPTLASPIPTAPAPGTSPAASASGIHHVFVIVLENAPYAESYGLHSKYRYLAQTLRPQGTLLSQYYATAHYSLGNYLAIIGGVAPNKEIQLDCGNYQAMVNPTNAADGQVSARSGCIFPEQTPTLAGQLTAANLSWKGYMEDMGNVSGREQGTCGVPSLGNASADLTQKAVAGDAYAARHNPFLYFDSVVNSPTCITNVVPLSQLTKDLGSIESTPNFSFISPSLCNDGHDDSCQGQPAGPAAEDAWLKTWVTQITQSAAFRTDGALIIVNDEASGDSSACCSEPSGPNIAYPGGTDAALMQAAGGGKGGGRTGALVLSPFVVPGAVSAVPYNHYSLLRTVEDIFGVSHLGYAGQPELHPFGTDVWTAAAHIG